MKRKLYGILAIFFFMPAIIGCSAIEQGKNISVTPVEASIPATVTFFDRPVELGGIQWMEGQAMETGVNIYYTGVHAFDKNTALLYGGIEIPAGTLRSSLFRTQNGGKDWGEVMEPVVGSEVVSISFVEGGKGWALVMWTVEGPGKMMLYGSQDYGQSWAKLAEVPKWQWYGYPARMDFADAKNGQIEIVYADGLPSTNHVGLLTTSDGGIHWKETGSFPLNSNSRESISTAMAKYYQQYPKPDLWVSRDKDGGTWRIGEERQSEYVVITREMLDSGKVVKLAIPRHYPYEKIK